MAYGIINFLGLEMGRISEVVDNAKLHLLMLVIFFVGTAGGMCMVTAVERNNLPESEPSVFVGAPNWSGA